MRRGQFITRLRSHARRHNLLIEVDKRRGKGSHITVIVAGRETIVKSGELKPGYVQLLLKQLGLPRGAV